MIRHFAAHPEIPLLFSANAFFSRRRDGTRYLRSVNLPPGLDVALDSAGYVAMAKYGRYPWSDEEYLDLVSAYPWAFYSVPDLCVEPEIANDRTAVRIRMAGTVAAYYRVSVKAADRGLPPPMPVLQGRTLSDYLHCADRLPTDGLVGLGSFCRREIGGEMGITHIVEKLAEALPQARFHLFGVKGAALNHIGQHPQVESVDSMAWDMAARTERRVGRTIEFRLQVMHRWLNSNRRRKLEPSEQNMSGSSYPAPKFQEDDELTPYLDLVEEGCLGYEDAARYAQHEWIGWQNMRYPPLQPLP